MQLTTKSGNKPFYAHNRVIVIGQDAANRRLSDIIDYFERNFDSRASELICVAKNTDAEKVIRAKLLNDTVKSKILEKMLEQSYKESLVPRMRIIDAVNAIKDETSYICIPAVTVRKNGENEDFKLFFSHGEGNNPRSAELNIRHRISRCCSLPFASVCPKGCSPLLVLITVPKSTIACGRLI